MSSHSCAEGRRSPRCRTGRARPGRAATRPPEQHAAAQPHEGGTAHGGAGGSAVGAWVRSSCPGSYPVRARAPQPAYAAGAMRILYGVVGEGMGHATRSRVLLEELTQGARGAHRRLRPRAGTTWRKRFENVHGIWGFTMAYEGNSVTQVADGAAEPQGRGHRLAAEHPRSTSSWWRSSSRTSWSATSSPSATCSRKNHCLPVISVDNMQIINRCKHEPELLAGLRGRLRDHARHREGEAARLPSTTSSPRSSTRRCARSAPRCCRPSCGRRSSRRSPSPASTCSCTRRRPRNTALPDIAQGERAALPRLRHAPRHHGGRGRRQPHVPALQRGGLHRRSAHRARRWWPAAATR